MLRNVIYYADRERIIRLKYKLLYNTEKNDFLRPFKRYIQFENVVKILDWCKQYLTLTCICNFVRYEKQYVMSMLVCKCLVPVYE